MCALFELFENRRYADCMLSCYLSHSCKFVLRCTNVHLRARSQQFVIACFVQNSSDKPKIRKWKFFLLATKLKYCQVFEVPIRILVKCNRSIKKLISLKITRKPVGFMQSCCYWPMTYVIHMSSAHHADNICMSSACHLNIQNLPELPNFMIWLVFICYIVSAESSSQLVLILSFDIWLNIICSRCFIDIFW